MTAPTHPSPHSSGFHTPMFYRLNSSTEIQPTDYINSNCNTYTFLNKPIEDGFPFESHHTGNTYHWHSYSTHLATWTTDVNNSVSQVEFKRPLFANITYRHADGQLETFASTADYHGLYSK